MSGAHGAPGAHSGHSAPGAHTGPPAWRDGHQAARAAADPVYGPGVDGQETDDPALRAQRATRAFEEAHVVDWDSDVPFDLRGYYENPDKVEAHEVDAAGVVHPPLRPGAMATLSGSSMPPARRGAPPSRPAAGRPPGARSRTAPGR